MGMKRGKSHLCVLAISVLATGSVCAKGHPVKKAKPAVASEVPKPQVRPQSVETSPASKAIKTPGNTIATLPTVKVTAEAANTVADDPQAYNITHSAIGTKTDTPILLTPMNIQVVRQQVLQDQQAVRIDKALDNVSGVYTIPNGLIGTSFSARGFDNYVLYRDGVRINRTYLDTPFRDMTNIEQVEMLKGPAAILYGRLEPGGMVNVTTKQPLASPYYSLQQQFGSYSFYRTTVDATGPVTQDGSLLYRFNLGYENAGSFREFVENERVLVAPKLHWNISEQTQANFYVEYLHSRDPMGGQIPAIGNRPADVPRERNLGEPGNHKTTDDTRVGFNWSHAFNDRWTLRHYFDANFVSAPTMPSILTRGLDDPAHCTRASCKISRYASSNQVSQNNQIYYTSLNLTGKVDTWFMEHTLLVGWDYLDTTTRQGSAIVDPVLPATDLYHPVHGGSAAALLTTPDYSYTSDLDESWNGFYMQDQVKLPYDVHLLAGFRYDNVNVNYLSYDLPITPASVPFSQFAQHETAVKPRFGLLWQPLPELSVYGNYVENFGISNLIDSMGVPLPPTTAQQYEAGIKTELFDKRLTGSLAWFDITKQNVSTVSPDPVQAAKGFGSATGEVRNQGVELDLAGEVWPGLKLIGSYAYINSRITKDVGLGYDPVSKTYLSTTGNQGHRYWGVPRHGGSLWATYELQGGDLQGLKVGAGVVARGQREADNANSVQLPGYAVLNLMASYSWKMGRSKLTAQINADNLLDKAYYSSGGGTDTLVSAPRSFLGSIRVEF